MESDINKSELLSVIDVLKQEISLLRQRVAFLEARCSGLPMPEEGGYVFTPVPFGGDYDRAAPRTDMETCRAVAANEHVFERLSRWWDAKDVRKHGYKPPPDPWAGPPGKPPPGPPPKRA